MSPVTPVTLDQVAHEVLEHCPLAGINLCRLWARNAWDELVDYREWSWRLRHGVFNIPDAYSTGTVSITSTDPTLVTGVGTTFTQAMVGRQFSTGGYRVFDIVSVIDATHLRLDLPWGEADVSGAGYIIAKRYVTPPADFHSFVSVVDVKRNYKLRTGVEKRELDRRDPRRTNAGNGYVIADAGYSSVFSGSVDPTPITALGSGNAPVFTGTFTGPADALYVVEITTGGAVGTAVFKWKKDNGAYVTGVTTSATAIGLIDGISVYFPTATYTVGNIFIARATAVVSGGIPRYEIWPNQLSQIQYPFYYVARLGDMFAPGMTLPAMINPGVISLGALKQCTLWPGPGDGKVNPYADRVTAARMAGEWDNELAKLCIVDDNVYPIDVSYFRDLPFGGPPWDAQWEQVHA